MIDNELEKIGKLVKELAKNKIDNDTKQGEDLLNRCLIHHKKNDCDSTHQNDVKGFISRIDIEYATFLKIFAKSKNLNVINKKVPVDCRTIEFYVEMLQNIKNIKDTAERIENGEKILKGGKNG
ncbi:MAG: hypothetical protein IJK67_04795 [Bacilli bacterium]|nr:hypothetical protein [Bacilli bacterium]